MKRLYFSCTNDLDQFHDELRAAVPALENVHVDGRGIRISEVEDLRVEGSGNDVWVTVVDDADETAIRQVVDAHTPR